MLSDGAHSDLSPVAAPLAPELALREEEEGRAYPLEGLSPTSFLSPQSTAEASPAHVKKVVRVRDDTKEACRKVR